jgi:Cu/Ag efflux pump CusA
MRLGFTEWNGQGEAVGGVVVMRYGENALRVIDAVKEKIEEIETGLPPGVSIVTTYDVRRISATGDGSRADRRYIESPRPGR